MARVRPGGPQRWANRVQTATQDYAEGVANPRRSWQASTSAAQDAYKAGVTKAAAEGRFAKGVAKAGDEKWKRKATTVGAERFGPGAAAAVQDYQSGVAPYIQTIESTNLPPRGPKGDPRNIERVRVLADALHKRKQAFGVLPLLILVAGLCGLLVAWQWTNSLEGSAPQTPRSKAEKLIAAKVSPIADQKGLLLVVAAVVVAVGMAGAALEVISASATAAPAGGAAMAAVTGDSLQVRNASLSTPPVVLTHWIKSQTAGFYQWTHASGHDQVRGFRGRHNLATALPLMAPGWPEQMQPQEVIAATIGAGAVAGDIELLHWLLYYPDLPGIQSSLISLEQLDSRMVEYVTVEDTTTATAGAAYSGARAINAASDLLWADTWYAILGAHVAGLCGALTIRGVDLGNLRVAIPGMNARPDLTARWFPFLCEEFGLPLIPIINSSNRGGIFVENVQDENLTAVPFALVMARLSS